MRILYITNHLSIAKASGGLVNNFDEQKYFTLLNEMFDYTKHNLTTKNIANYLLEKII